MATLVLEEIISSKNDFGIVSSLTHPPLSSPSMETTVLSVFRKKLVVTVGVSLKGQRFRIFPNCMMGFQAAALIERGECAFISVLFCWSARRPVSTSLSKGDSARTHILNK